MRRDLVTSVIAVVVVTVLFGVAYPLLVTGAAQVAFPGRADGSKITRHGRLVGSRLIAQDFRTPVLDASGKPKLDKAGKPVLVADARYFQPRPSTATDYNAAASAFTNLGPNSATARDTFKATLRSYLQLERPYAAGLTAAGVPIDAVTSSASGIDPHISPANAAIQAHRIAVVRHLPPSQVDRLIHDHTDRRFLGVLGEPGVNVLELNLSIDHATTR
jgi:potassium-transporting ATPase KdpC subunit